ncbi:N-anthranilate isomerase [Limtongia smithiae]|uniref:N-anthranilate isomerase n=1 Tax=Limtongia smithiae TaxID=1125753 RepID=UPI0034CD4E21
MPPSSRAPPLVKICGTRTPEAAQHAVESGADLIGMICVPNVKRTVKAEQARAISRAVRALERIRREGPFVVGVFRNQSLEEVLAVQADYELDMVQLHGKEPLEWTKAISVPVIKTFGPADQGVGTPGLHSVALLDSGSGGEGTMLPWEALPTGSTFVLAGGLTPDNVAGATRVPNVGGVDVSSGVETDGRQDLDKITLFIRNAKG